MEETSEERAARKAMKKEKKESRVSGDEKLEKVRLLKHNSQTHLSFEEKDQSTT
jgi:hypothetical protein